jgi:hypothetical protein
MERRPSTVSRSNSRASHNRMRTSLCSMVQLQKMIPNREDKGPTLSSCESHSIQLHEKGDGGFTVSRPVLIRPISPVTQNQLR